jgi:ADP-ribose pyrophosphatase YjhB (NUDIX family)
VRQGARLIATALVEHEDRLLLVQLASGRFAGFWLLPSASVEQGTVAETAARMLPERTGCFPTEQQLVCVQEEPKTGVLAVRFVFDMQIREETVPITDPEIAALRWITRDDALEILEERDMVPTLGVMHLLRAWADKIVLPPLATLDIETLCPCGSGFSYRGCCGWDM